MNLHRCDGCRQERRDVQSVGRDYNGDPDAPDLCFICRKRAERGERLPTDPDELVREPLY
jgi:hypothetical protein